MMINPRNFNRKMIFVIVFLILIYSVNSSKNSEKNKCRFYDSPDSNNLNKHIYTQEVSYITTLKLTISYIFLLNLIMLEKNRSEYKTVSMQKYILNVR